MKIVNQIDLSPEALASIERALPSFGTLLEFATWGAKQQPPALFIETIAQDEYTHDVICGWRDELFLVFGST